MAACSLLDTTVPLGLDTLPNDTSGLSAERKQLPDSVAEAAVLSPPLRQHKRVTSFGLMPGLTRAPSSNLRRSTKSSENEPPSLRSVSYCFSNKRPLADLFDGASEVAGDCSTKEEVAKIGEPEDESIHTHCEQFRTGHNLHLVTEKPNTLLDGSKIEEDTRGASSHSGGEGYQLWRCDTTRHAVSVGLTQKVALSTPRPRPRIGQRPQTFATRSADRFVFGRRPGVDIGNSFQASRPASQMTNTERRLRRRTGVSDSFGPPTSRSASIAVRSPERLLRSPPFRAAGLLDMRRDSESVFNSISSSVTVNSRIPTRRTSRRASSVHVSDGRGNWLSSGSSARFITPKFFDKRKAPESLDTYEKRLGLALGIDLIEKILKCPKPSTTPARRLSSIPRLGGYYASNRGNSVSRTLWQDNEWKREGPVDFLEAVGLRDDYYCSVLAYSHAADRLAVGIGAKIYLWSEEEGLIHPPSQFDTNASTQSAAYITSVAFSSEASGKAILAVSRADGRLVLWSPLDTEPRFISVSLPHSAAFVTFRPHPVKRTSQRHGSVTAENEVMLVGDIFGNIWVFLVEWPKEQDRYLFGWEGGLVLHARISVHVQHVCGIAWTSDGELFATGGNDNLCCLFRTSSLFTEHPSTTSQSITVRQDSRGNHYLAIGRGEASCLVVGYEQARHQWRLSAAVKAIAFCPWQKGLMAAGGGSNDRCVHFYHTVSGACLATIDCAAQVTALIWSNTCREIAATLGFPQPEHPFRIVVYAWPSCEQVITIPWHDEMRALYAIPYPGGADRRRKWKGEQGPWWGRDTDQGSIVVAGSDGSIKFHEIWADDRIATGSHHGLLGGSAILESLHGVEKEGRETIR